jgi:hypothetical protein
MPVSVFASNCSARNASPKARSCVATASASIRGAPFKPSRMLARMRLACAGLRPRSATSMARWPFSALAVLSAVSSALARCQTAQCASTLSTSAARSGGVRTPCSSFKACAEASCTADAAAPTCVTAASTWAASKAALSKQPPMCSRELGRLTERAACARADPNGSSRRLSARSAATRACPSSWQRRA